MTARSSSWRRFVKSLLASSLMAAITLGTYSYFTLWACVRSDDAASTTIAGAVTAAGVSGLAITFLLMRREGDSAQDEVAALSWVRQNRFRLPEDLVLGGGPSIDDLAHAAGVSRGNVPAFGALLRDNRQTLFALVQRPDTKGPEALEFFRRIGDLVSAHPVLGHEFAAAVNRHPGASPTR